MAWEAFVSYLLCFAPHIPTTLTFHLFLKYVHAHTRANVCNTVFAENSSQRSPQCFLPLSIWITALKITFFTGVLFDYLVYLLLCLAVFLFLALIAILQSTVICLLILSFLLGISFMRRETITQVSFPALDFSWSLASVRYSLSEWI